MMISGSNNRAVIEVNCPNTPIVTLGTTSDQIANTVTVPGLAAQVPAMQVQDPVHEVLRPYAGARIERLRPVRPLFHPAQNPGLDVPGLNPWRRVFERQNATDSAPDREAARTAALKRERGREEDQAMEERARERAERVQERLARFVEEDERLELETLELLKKRALARIEAKNEALRDAGETFSDTEFP